MVLKKIFQIDRLSRLLSNPYLCAVRDGLTITLPIIIVATVAILINSFPSQTYAATMTSIFGPNWKIFGQYVYNGSYGVISLIMVFSISYSLAENRNSNIVLERVNPAIVAFVAFSSLFCVMEPGLFNDNNEDTPAYVLRWLGVHGLLLSTIIALASSSIFRYFLKFRSLRIILYSGSSGVAMTHAMSTLLPALLTISFFALLKVLLFAVFGINDMNLALYHLLYLPFDNLGGDNLFTALTYGFARHFLWFIGIHGSNVLEPVMQELYVPAIALNISAGQVPLFVTDVLPGQFAVFTKPFFDCYTSMGGAGSTIGLLLACLIAHRDSGTRKIARISIIPSFFNINEILLFGLPVVLNPLFLIPFILVPILNTCIAEAGILLGIVPLTTEAVAWNIPLLLNAYKATGSVLGSFLQVFNIVLSTLIYLPFVLLDNKIKAAQFKDTFHRLVSVACDTNQQTEAQPRLLSLPNPVGALVQSVATDMGVAVKRGEVFFQYQPQVDSSTGRVLGFESLIRWRHPHIGMVPPPLLIGLAEETGYIEQLGLWSIEQAVKQLAEWRQAGITDLVMSVNMSSKQLNDGSLPDTVAKILQRYNVPSSHLKIELTESLALTAEMIKNQILSRFHDMGIALAIDDFGMGHSSIMYIKQFNVHTIKLDAVLTRDVLASKSSCEIISSIVDLCQTMNIAVIAEFVEDAEHLVRLRELGCYVIQGYFYSRPLDPDKCLEFIKKTHRSFGPPAPQRFPLSVTDCR